MPVFQSLLFDLDGTLVNSLVDLGNAVNDLRIDLNLEPIGQAEIAAFIGDGARLLVQRALPPGTFCEAHLDKFLGHYRDRLVETTRPYPGILDCLENCQDLDLAVVTNKPYVFAIEILKHLNLHRFFRVVVGGDSADAKKPDPSPVRLALQQMDCPSETALLVGDHVNDLLAGQAAGVQTCFCRWGFGEHREVNRDFEVNNPLELKHLLRSKQL